MPQNTLRAVFCIPEAQEVGGVGSWALQVARMGIPSRFFVHLERKYRRSPSAYPASADRIWGTSPWIASVWNVWEFARRYKQALPAAYIPNWSHGTYAACALLSRRHSESMRVIGFGHTDQDHYYRHLAYYEPMIHRFVAVSKEIAEGLRRALPHRAKDIELRPYPIAAPANLVRSYSAAGQPLRLVYAGRIEQPQKRVLDLLAIAELLAERNVNFRLDVYGDGRDENLFRKALAEVPAATRRFIQWHPKVPAARMGEVWRAADVCLQTSAYEGISISMLEAMAHGCVPVVTRVSGVAAVVRPAVTGYFAEVGELYDLAGHLEALAADRALLARMGRAAQTEIDARFSPERYAEWFKGLMSDVWNEPARPFPADRPCIPAGAPTLPHRWHYYGKRWLLKTYVNALDRVGIKTPRRNSPLLTSS